MTGDRAPGLKESIDSRERELTDLEWRLNAVDAVIGAEAAQTQTQIDVEAAFYRLHLRETEVITLRDALADDSVGAARPRRARRKRPASAVEAHG